VELARYRRFDPHGDWQEDRYVAYLLTQHGPPQWVALGPASVIDSAVEAVLATMHGGVSVETTKAALRHLDALVFAVVRDRLTGVSHIVLAPDSRLNLAPFEALVDSDGRFAGENFLVSYVTSGRDLLRLAVPLAPRSPAVIMAPDFGLGGAGFAPLPDALAEATDLQEHFPIVLTGDRATKASLAALTGPAMLHIATHGFYDPSPGPPPSVPTRGARDVITDNDEAWLRSPPHNEDPADSFDRAGLAMAGANHGAEGIVTARELAGFDWWGTQLVVLSACRTGVGAVPAGDGVHGMRRALVLAGAASQVVSLWNVSDSATRELMRDLYRGLANGVGRAEALRQAKLSMMARPHHAHPYYWAAFVLAGDWRRETLGTPSTTSLTG
jgi:CHAT domain-containing protein